MTWSWHHHRVKCLVIIGENLKWFCCSGSSNFWVIITFMVETKVRYDPHHGIIDIHMSFLAIVHSTIDASTPSWVVDHFKSTLMQWHWTYSKSIDIICGSVCIAERCNQGRKWLLPVCALCTSCMAPLIFDYVFSSLIGSHDSDVSSSIFLIAPLCLCLHKNYILHHWS